MIATIDSLAFGFSSDKPIFSGFDWKVGRGDRWAILGPSGCGKSTLLLLLAGILKPDAGEMIIGGKKLVRPRPRTGLILQNYGLLPWATVRENVELGLNIRQFYGPDGTHAPEQEEYQAGMEKASYWINRLGLEETKERYPAQISGGQQQRTAIARTLALSPDLLLMDEPFGSLDAPTSDELQGQIVDLQKEESLTLMIVTHSVETAANLGQKILVLGNPPNMTAQIVENSNSGAMDYRYSQAYQSVCDDLRKRLERSV